MRRFFVDPKNINGPVAVITGQEARHISNVLRLAVGTKVILFDGSGSYYEAVLSRISPGKSEAKIVSIMPYIEDAGALQPALHLGIGLLKGKKMDLVIQKITELGVASLLPFVSRYCVAKEQSGNRISRWEKIALEACKQCNRPKPPEISPIRNLDEIIADSQKTAYDLRLILWENNEGQKSLRDIFAPLQKVRSVMVLIGPEGGFTADEVKFAVDNGYEPVTMGSRILRAETAVIAAVSIIQHELDNMA